MRELRGKTKKYCLWLNIMNLKKSTIVCLFFSFIVFPNKFMAQDKTSIDEQFDRLIYEDFKKIKIFGPLIVLFEGDAEKIGLNKNDLTDFLKLKVKNNFAGFQIKTIDRSDLEKSISPTIGRIVVSVWVVGTDYPVAFHIEIQAGSLNKFDIYEKAILGYGSKNNVPNTIKKVIGDLIEAFAIKFYKVRSEI
jgi:hypothetical protein